MPTSSSKNYWFKRRRYGYGWTPVKPQGWLMLIGFLAIIIGSIASLDKVPMDLFVEFLISVIILCILSLFVLLLVVRKKGPTPKWRWGKSPSDNPDEDL
jgi:hypothetical protein